MHASLLSHLRQKACVQGSTAAAALRGEFGALTGLSGCGKTTLLNLTGAIDTPSRGTLLVNGALAAHLPTRHLLRKTAAGILRL